MGRFIFCDTGRRARIDPARPPFQAESCPMVSGLSSPSFKEPERMLAPENTTLKLLHLLSKRKGFDALHNILSYLFA